MLTRTKLSSAVSAKTCEPARPVASGPAASSLLRCSYAKPSLTHPLSEVPPRRQQARRRERHRHHHDVRQLPTYLGDGSGVPVASETREDPRGTAERLAWCCGLGSGHDHPSVSRKIGGSFTAIHQPQTRAGRRRVPRREASARRRHKRGTARGASRSTARYSTHPASNPNLGRKCPRRSDDRRSVTP